MKKYQKKIIPFMVLCVLLFSNCHTQSATQPATEPVSYNTSPASASPYALCETYMPAILLNNAELEVEQRFLLINEKISENVIDLQGAMFVRNTDIAIDRIETEYKITNNTNRVQTAEMGFVDAYSIDDLEREGNPRVLLDGKPAATDLSYITRRGERFKYDTDYKNAVKHYAQYFDNYSVSNLITELKHYKEAETVPSFYGKPCTLYTFDLVSEAGTWYFYFDINFDRSKTKIMVDRGKRHEESWRFEDAEKGMPRDRDYIEETVQEDGRFGIMVIGEDTLEYDFVKVAREHWFAIEEGAPDPKSFRYSVEVTQNADPAAFIQQSLWWPYAFGSNAVPREAPGEEAVELYTHLINEALTQTDFITQETDWSGGVQPSRADSRTLMNTCSFELQPGETRVLSETRPIWAGYNPISDNREERFYCILTEPVKTWGGNTSVTVETIEIEEPVTITGTDLKGKNILISYEVERR